MTFRIDPQYKFDGPNDATGTACLRSKQSIVKDTWPRASDYLLNRNLAPRPPAVRLVCEPRALKPPASVYDTQLQALNEALTTTRYDRVSASRVGEELFKAGAKVALGQTIALGVGYCLGQGAASTDSQATMLGQAINSSWSSVYDALTSGKGGAQQECRRLFAHFKQSSQTLAAALPPVLQERLRQLDQDIGNAIYNSSVTEFETLMRRRQGVILGYPTQGIALARTTHAMVSDEDAKRFAQIDANVRALVADYGHVPMLEGLITRIRARSVFGSGAVRSQLFLVGPPGVGKTFFVERLRDALGLPLVTKNLSDKDAGGVFSERTMDPYMASHAFREKATTDEAVLGAVPFALTSAGYKNALIFFDEVGESLNPASSMMGYNPGPTVDSLKRFFDRGNAKVGCDTLAGGLQYDFGWANVIVAGNQLPKDAALASRFDVIHFPDMPAEQKRDIGARFVRGYILGKSGIGDVTKHVLADQADAFVGRVVDSAVAQGISGVREIRAALQNIADSLMARQCMGAQLDDATILADATHTFARTVEQGAADTAFGGTP